ncbi:MAG: FecR domain-containing protein [Bacteroidetes bacterium]|nr:FecR domain-containing protein [Bacteroidota bacterium]
MNSEERFKELLDRYLDGNATPGEAQIVERWFEQGGDTGKRDLQLSETEKKLLLENIRRQTRGPVIPMVWRWAAAAIVTGAVVMGGILVRSSKKVSPIGLASVVTGKGEIKKMALPDGSVVWLNANSVLSYCVEFKQRRELKLSGEALFDVAEDKAHPFVVTTSDSVRTEVLGTVFNVTSRGETSVAVLSGKVQVGKAGVGAAILTRQQSVRYSGGTLARIDAPAEIANWTKGEWVYNNMRIGDLMRLLNDQYNITVRNKHTKGDGLQTGLNVNFNRRQPPEDIVSIFCALAGCHYKKTDTTTFEVFN